MFAKSPIILRFDQKSEHVIAHARRISGFVKIRALLPIIDTLNLDANPRESKVGPITQAIQDSLDRTPDTFPSKTKGLLIGCSDYRELERNRIELNFQDSKLEGILDGGHNTLAIGLHVLEHVGIPESRIKKIKRWGDFRSSWNTHVDLIEATVRESDDPVFDILVPVELLVPASMEQNAIDEFSSSLLDICAARNNNAQLKAETKANQSGYFDDLKAALPIELRDNIEWKTNDGGRIKVADVIALSWIPLSLLDLPEDEDGRQVSAPLPQNIYRSKGDCVTRFERLMSSPSVTASEDGEYRRELVSEPVRSALKITADILSLYDEIYAKFPEAHNTNGGRFGSITVIKTMNPSDGARRAKKSKFFQKPVNWNIPDGFIIPLVYGLRSLIQIDDNQCLSWAVNPYELLGECFNDIASDHSGTMSMLDYDPQKVGKEHGSYRFAERAFQTALSRFADSWPGRQGMLGGLD